MRQSAERGALLARPLKFAPLLWAWLWRRPGRTLLAFIAVMLAFTLYGLALGEAEGFARAAAARHADIGQGFLLGAMAVSAIGFGLIWAALLLYSIAGLLQMWQGRRAAAA